MRKGRLVSPFLFSEELFLTWLFGAVDHFERGEGGREGGREGGKRERARVRRRERERGKRETRSERPKRQRK